MVDRPQVHQFYNLLGCGIVTFWTFSTRKIVCVKTKYIIQGFNNWHKVYNNKIFKDFRWQSVVKNKIQLWAVDIAGSQQDSVKYQIYLWQSMVKNKINHSKFVNQGKVTTLYSFLKIKWS